MEIFKKVDKGIVRPTNQDAAETIMLSDNVAFGIVCDGMGGANGGDIASNRATEIICEYVRQSYTPGMNNEAIVKLLKNAIDSANYEVFDCSQREPSLHGMGTTVVAAIVTGDYAVICHIGDSRAYLINDTIVQLTTDHSIVQSLLESGKISATEAKTFPDKNVITRALGVEENIVIDHSVVHLSAGDVIMLCTDGLSNYVDSSQIFNTFNTESTDNVADKLIDMANAAGGGDNISVVIISQKEDGING